MVVCVRIVAYSSSVSLPGFSRISDGMSSLPTSCMVEAMRMLSIRSGLRPSCSAMTREYSETRLMCWPVWPDLFSVISAKERMISSWMRLVSSARSWI